VWRRWKRRCANLEPRRFSTRTRGVSLRARLLRTCTRTRGEDQHGRQRPALDNVFVERLWRSVKYEEVYLKGYETMAEAKAGLGEYLRFYNEERFHQGLDERTPNDVYFGHGAETRAA